MQIAISEPRAKAFDQMLAKRKVRLRNMVTGEFLHLSGAGDAKGTAYSWLGFTHQAEALRARAEAAGQPWPYTVIHRDLAGRTEPNGEA